MADYTSFDAKLLERIQRKAANFTQLSTYMNADAKAIISAQGGDDRDAFRVTDRRLQALRKRGLIKYSGKTGWSAIPQPKATNPEAAH